MKIHFDPGSLRKWKENNITDISVRLIESGCAGRKIQITEEKLGECTLMIDEDHDLRIWIDPEESMSLDGARVTRTEKGWIFSHPSVQTRCGCGQSFAISSGDPRQDKIQALRLRLKKAHHTPRVHS